MDFRGARSGCHGKVTEDFFIYLLIILLVSVVSVVLFRPFCSFRPFCLFRSFRWFRFGRFSRFVSAVSFRCFVLLFRVLVQAEYHTCNAWLTEKPRGL